MLHKNLRIFEDLRRFFNLQRYSKIFSKSEESSSSVHFWSSLQHCFKSRRISEIIFIVKISMLENEKFVFFIIMLCCNIYPFQSVPKMCWILDSELFTFFFCFGHLVAVSTLFHFDHKTTSDAVLQKFCQLHPTAKANNSVLAENTRNRN